MDDCTAEVNICDDLVMDILSRLPPISLLVCNRVSKSWRRLVSTLIHSRATSWPMTSLFLCFSDYERNRVEDIKFLNLTGDNDELDYSRLDYLPCYPDTRLVDCRDGLLLCSSSKYYEQDKYFVCNPITRQWVSLPYPPERYSSSGYPWPAPIAALVLDDDDDDDEEFDFCYSHFKVIRFVNLKDHVLEDEVELSCYLYVDVFYSKTGKWEGSKPKDFTTFTLSDRSLPACSDGVLFLLGLPCGDPPFHLLLYHVKEEYSEELLLPADFASFDFNCLGDSNCLGKSEGHLHYAYRYASKMEVWMMIERGGHSHRTSECEWVLKHSLNLADIGFPVPDQRRERLDIVAFHPNSDEIFIKRNGDFFCYDFKTKAMDKVAYYKPSETIDGVVPWSCYRFYLYPFSPCLCRLEDAKQST